MEIIASSFGRVLALFTETDFTTYYTIFCTLILCALFQIFILRRAAKREGISLTGVHFIGVYIFLIYIAYVYIVTGLGTIWDIAYYQNLAQVADIYLIPFSTFEMLHVLSNIISYLLNILMLMPFGFMLALIWPSFRSIKKIALTGFLFSLAIEISQLFNYRATTIDDLILNTVGAVLGYLVFALLYKIVTKNDNKDDEQDSETYNANDGEVANSVAKSVDENETINRESGSNKNNITNYKSRALKHEAVIYLVCSFVGVFLFFNSMMYVDWGADRDEIGGVFLEDDLSKVTYNYMEALLSEVNADSIVVDIIETFRAPDGGLIGGNTGIMTNIATDENTVFEIWQSNADGSKEPVVSVVSKADLKDRELLNIYFRDDSDNVADKIVILRFDG